MTRHVWRTALNLRRRLCEILEHGPIGDRTGLIVGRFIVILIVTNLVAMTLESVPALQAQYGPLFIAIELLSLVVFTIEYGLRVWVAAEHGPHRHSSERQARWQFVTSPLGVIDLLAVLPFWFAFVLPADLRVLLVFRMVRFLKLARYSPAMRSLLDALYNERRALFGCFVILLGATLLAASIMHVVERHAQPDKFGTIPEAMWWAIVTLGTIGYGDVVPDRTRPTRRIGHDLRWLDHDRLAHRHRRHGLRRRDSPSRLCRHLGNGRSRSVIRRTAGAGYHRHYGFPLLRPRRNTWNARPRRAWR